MSSIHKKARQALFMGIILMTFLTGCSGTGTGNPELTAGNVETSAPTYISALPEALLPADNVIGPLFGEIEGDQITAEQFIHVFPDIFRSLGDTLIVSGANRGMQIVDLLQEDSPEIRGHVYIPGSHVDIDLNQANAYLLTLNSLQIINTLDQSFPFVEAIIPLGEETFRIFSYDSQLVRLSKVPNGQTQVDLVSAYEVNQPAAAGLILPIQVTSAKRYDHRLWVVGPSLLSEETCLMGINLEALRIETALLDLSESTCASLESGNISSQVSEVVTVTDSVPLTEPAADLFVWGPSYSKLLEMRYGIWMDVPLYIVIADDFLAIYDLVKNGELTSIISMPFQPESFFISGSNLSFSYLRLTDPPEGADTTKNFARFYYRSYDLSDPENPTESMEVNIPGTLLSLKDNLVYTLDFSWDNNGKIIETIKLGQVQESKVNVIGESELSQRTTNRFVSGSSVITILEGSGNSWSELIQITDFSVPVNPLNIE